MKAKKVLLSSLVLAGVVSACTDENIVDVQNNAPLAERTQVNLTLNVPGVDSRMSNGSGWASNMESHDVLGAVLVDKGYNDDNTLDEVWNNVDWTPIAGHVGNNKWAFDPKAGANGKFVTEGTTSVGSWLFYTKYNEKMTTSRNGVEFDFPQIQEGAKDLAWVMNNNTNFMISPVLNVDGYEGENLEFDIRVASVYSYLRMPFDLSKTGASKVQKIIVRAKNGSDVDLKFNTKLKVNNTILPQAGLSKDADIDEVKCPDYNDPANGYDLYDINKEIEGAYNKLVYQGFNWETGVLPSVNWVIGRDDDQPVDHLVVDLDGEHNDKAGNGGLDVAKDGKFSAVMLMPAGVYGSLIFDIYTDKGVYTKTVSSRYGWYDDLTAVEKTALNLTAAETSHIANTSKKIFLRPGRVVVLSDIENKCKDVADTAPTLTDREYLKVTDESENPMYITKTADLINLINGIEKLTGETGDIKRTVNVLSQPTFGDADSKDELVPEHAVIVNQAVMDAVVAKESQLGNIQLVFSGAQIKVKGNTAGNALDIHDMTFNDGVEIISGNVKATSELVVPTNKTMKVCSGVNLELALINGVDDFYRLEVKSGAVVNATTNANVKRIANAGAFTVATGKTITNEYFYNENSSAVNGVLLVDKEFTNTVDGTFTNAGTVTLTAVSSNAGSLTNNGQLNVKNDFTNNGTINVSATAKIHVNSDVAATLTNAKGATIVNNGMLYTKVGPNNKIANLGTIDAKASSTTYITTNSKSDEKTVATNDEDQIMGTIKIEKRNVDVSVTTPNQQGYIQYVVVATDLENGILNAVKHDKFNKVIFSSAAELSTDVQKYVNFIETSSDLTLPSSSRIQELQFTGNASLYSDVETGSNRSIISKLTINKDVLVKVPTENDIHIFGMTSFIATSSTTQQIINNGELLVGGDLYTSLAQNATQGTGEFNAGDGNATAFHWGATW